MPVGYRTVRMFSLIILNWNGKKWLSRCIDSILRQSCKEYEIIFVDNDSQDGSVAYVRDHYPFVTVVANERNDGYAWGNNIGARAAKGDILFFLNNDTVLREDCLERLHDAIHASPDHAGIFALQFYSYDGAVALYAPGRWMGVDFLGYPCSSKIPFYADGAALVIKKDLFKKLRGFDQAHFMFAEDIDVCWRARLLGYHIVGVDGAVVCHAVGGSTFDGTQDGNVHVTSVTKRYLAERNTIRNMLKNYSGGVLLCVLPVAIFLYVIESILCLLLLRFDMIGNVYLKALRYNLSMLGDTLRERKLVQDQRTAADGVVLRDMSFVLSKYDLFTRTRLRDFVVKIEK